MSLSNLLQIPWLPFTVTSDQGIFIGTDCEGHMLDIPVGSYALVAEQGFLGQPPGGIGTGET